MPEIVGDELTKYLTDSAFRASKNVPDESMRHCKKFLCDDGSMATTFVKNCHTRKESGEFIDSDNTIVSQGGEQLDPSTGEKFTHKCEKVNIRVFLNTDKQPIKLRVDMVDILIKPLGVNQSSGTKLANKMTYRDVYQNVDIIREIYPEGLKNWALLTAPGHQTEFEFEVPMGLKKLKEYYSPGYLVNPENNSDVRLCSVEWTPTGFIWRLPDLTGLSYPILVDDSTFQQGVSGYTGTHDSRLAEVAGDTNYGTFAAYSIAPGDGGAGSQKNRGVLRNDVSSIDSGDTVTRIVQELFEYAVDENTSDTDWDITMYRLKRTWIQGDDTDGVTWNESHHDNGDHPGSCTSWTTGGADDTTDDREAAASAVVNYDDTAAGAMVAYDSDSNAQLLTDYQDIINSAGNNYGHVFISDNEVAPSGTFCQNYHRASEYATAAQRPKLTVYHSSPAGETGFMTTNTGYWGI